LALNDLTDVAVLGTPSNGQLLVFDSSVGQWRNLHNAVLDFITLTNEDPQVDTSFTIYRHPGPDSGVGAFLNIAGLTSTRFFRFPNADGTFALQNQFTVVNAVGTAVAVPASGSADAFANCPSGSQAVGVGVSALPSVAIQDMRIMSSTQVRVRARRGDPNASTDMNAIAYCMSMP
jgi:hypothetical protein